MKMMALTRQRLKLLAGFCQQSKLRPYSQHLITLSIQLVLLNPTTVDSSVMLLDLLASRRWEKMQAERLHRWRSKLKPSTALDLFLHGFSSGAQME